MTGRRDHDGRGPEGAKEIFSFEQRLSQQMRGADWGVRLTVLDIANELAPRFGGFFPRQVVERKASIPVPRSVPGSEGNRAGPRNPGAIGLYGCPQPLMTASISAAAESCIVSVTWLYRSRVVEMLVCPSISETTLG